MCLHGWNLDLGAEPGDLHFNAGEIIWILSDEPGYGWSTGQLHDKVGVYPTTYVEHLSSPLLTGQRQRESRPLPPVSTSDSSSDPSNVEKTQPLDGQQVQVSPTADLSLHTETTDVAADVSAPRRCDHAFGSVLAKVQMLTTGSGG